MSSVPSGGRRTRSSPLAPASLARLATNPAAWLHELPRSRNELMRLVLLPVLAIVIAAEARTQDIEAQVRALRPLDTSAAQTAVLDEIERRAASALGRIHRAATPADVQKARPELRRRLDESLGL